MNWNRFNEQLPADIANRGRPGPRFVRGLLWALLAMFVISILVFTAGQCNVPGDPALTL